MGYVEMMEKLFSRIIQINIGVKSNPAELKYRCDNCGGTFFEVLDKNREQKTENPGYSDTTYLYCINCGECITLLSQSFLFKIDENVLNMTKGQIVKYVRDNRHMHDDCSSKDRCDTDRVSTRPADIWI